MENIQDAVREFHLQFGIPAASVPTKMAANRVHRLAGFMSEEIQELIAANTLADQVDAAADLIYYAVGVFIETGVDANHVLRIVHQANMAKLVNGKPAFSEDGRVLKPRNWISPEREIEEWLASENV